MAILRHPILAAISGSESVNGGPISITQWHRWCSCRLACFQDIAYCIGPLDFHRKHGMLRTGARVLLATDSRLKILGAVDAWSRPRHIWSRHEFRCSGNFYHLKRAQVVSRVRRESTGHCTESEYSRYDVLKRLNWYGGRRTP
jgi:hypothetical protein